MLECPRCVEHCAIDPESLAELCVIQAERLGAKPMQVFNKYIRTYHENGHPTDDEADTLLLDRIGADKIECADCFMYIKDHLTDVVQFCITEGQRTRRAPARVLDKIMDEQHRRGHPTMFEVVAHQANTGGCPQCEAHVMEDPEDFGRRATEMSNRLNMPLDEYLRMYLQSWHDQGHPDDEESQRLLIDEMGIPNLPCADCRTDSVTHIKALAAACMLLARDTDDKPQAILARILDAHHGLGHPSPGEGAAAGVYFARLVVDLL